MSAHSAYLTSIFVSFSTFLSERGVVDRAAHDATLALAAVVEHKTDWTSWDLQRLAEFWQTPIGAQHSSHAQVLVAAFIRRYPPTQINVFVHEFCLALKANGCSHSTVKNYRSDISQFAQFGAETELNKLITKPKVTDFLRQQRSAGLKYSSIRRKLVSIQQFANWAAAQGIFAQPQWFAELFSALENAKPLEVLDAATSSPKPAVLPKAAVPVVASVPVSASSNPGMDSIQPTAPASPLIHQERTAQLQSVFSRVARKHLRRPSFGSGNPGQWALTALVLLVTLVGVGFFGYQQLLLRVSTPLAYPTSPTRPNRQLSFQGRLTDTAQNPITTATDMRFYLYDSGPSTGSGSQLWDSGTCSVTPDQDGIFSVGLGDDCGTEITEDVFSENSNVWLEVEIEAETLDPRQAIQTVPYALNSETLQGYPITASGAATVNTVVTMNSSGEVVLGEVSPTIRSVSGTFSLEAQTLTLETSSGSNGDIILSPDGTGEVQINADTEIDGYLYAPGATLSATYAGGTALVTRGGPSGTANIQEWQNSAGTALTVVDESGNLGIGTTTPNGKLAVSGTPTASANFGLISLGHGNWAGSGNDFAGGDADGTYLAINSEDATRSYIDIQRVGNTIFKLNQSGNVGINNSNPLEKLDITGGQRISGILTGVTGLELDTNDSSQITFSVNGSEKMRVTTGGNLGIASTSPTEKLDVVGNLKLSGTTTFNSLTYTWPASLSNGYVLSTNGSGTLSWSDPAVLAGGTNLWDSANGTLYPKNSTLDLLIGGTATSSAKFAFLNVDSGTPTASVSAGVAGGAYLTSQGKLATTALQNLTLGDSTTTGDVIINPSRNVGVGTTAPTTKLQIGDGTGSGSLANIAGVGTSPVNLTIGGVAGTNGNLILESQHNGGGNGVNVYTTRGNGSFNVGFQGAPSNGTGGSMNIGFLNSGWGGNLNFKQLNSTVATINSDGNVGIGSTSPTGKLNVSGAATGKALTILNESGDQNILVASASGSTKFLIENDGDIQTSSVVTIGGANNTAGSLYFFNNGVRLERTGNSGLNIITSGSGSVGGTTISGAAGGVPLIVKGATSQTASIQEWQNVGGTALMALSAAGNLGIGSASPTEVLDVVGNFKLSGTTTFNSLTYTWPASQTNGYVLSTNGSGTLSWSDPAVLAGGTNLWDSADGTLYPKNSTLDLLIGGTATSSAKFAFLNVDSGTPTASISGNLALSVPTGSTPASTLDILNGGTLNVRTSVGGSAGATSRLFLANNGNVGIGTTSPLFKLQIDTTSASDGISLRSGGTELARLRNNSNAYGDLILASSGTTKTFLTASTGDSYFNNDGNLGIGTSSPGGRLQINGGGTGVKSLLVRGNTSNDANIQEWQNGSGTAISSIRSDGFLSLNTTNSTAVLNAVRSASTTNAPVIESVITTTGTSTENAGAAYYGYSRNTSGTNSRLSSTMLQISHDRAGTITNLDQILTRTYVSDGAVTNLTGIRGDVYSVSGGTVTNARYLNIPSPSISGSGVITNLYGIYLNDQSGATTNNYAIVTNAGNVVFNEGGDSATDVRIEGDTDANLLFTDASADNVGIGTNAPVAKLDVYADQNSLFAGGRFYNNNSNSSAYTRVDIQGGTGALQLFDYSQNATPGILNLSAGSSAIRFTGTDGGILTQNNYSLQFGTNNTEVLRISGTGNVGIGSTSPGYQLDITASSNNVIRAVRGGNAIFTLGANAGDTDNAQLSLLGDGTTKVYLATRGTEESYFNNGNIGIGTTDPATLLSVGASSGTLGTDGSANVSTNGLNVDITSAGSALNTYAASIANYYTDGSTAGRHGLLVRAGRNGQTSYALRVQGYDASEILTARGDTFNVGIGSTTPSEKLDIVGNLKLTGTTTFNSLTYTWPASQSNGYVLSTNGSGTLSWTDPNTLITTGDDWDIASGTLYPKNSTLDLLIGGTATSSAKFAVLNVDSGTPTASVSAGAAGGAYLTSQGKLATTALQNLTLGDSTTTGDVIINPSRNVGIGTTAPERKLHVSGGAILLDFNQALVGEHSSGGTYYDLIKVGSGNNITVGSTIQDTRIHTASNLIFSPSSGDTWVVNASSIYPITNNARDLGTSSNYMRTGYFGTSLFSPTIYGGTGASSTLTLAGTNNGSPSSAHILLNTSNQGNVGIGTTSPTERLQVGATGGSIGIGTTGNSASNTFRINRFTYTNDSVSTAGQLSLFNDNTSDTYLMNIPDGSSRGFVIFPTALTDTTTAGIELYTGRTIANASGVKLSSTQNITGNSYNVGGVDIANTISFDPTNNLVGTVVSGVRIAQTFAPDATTKDVSYNGLYFGSTINQTGSTTATTRGIYINPTLTSAADFRAIDIANNSSSSYGIYQSGSSTDNYFAGNIGIGSTTPTEVLDIVGNLKLSGTTTFNSLTYTWPASQTNGYVLSTNGSGTLSWTDPNTLVSSGDDWDIASGALYPKNSTLDLLIGGTASTSAKFAFLNVDSGTPTASVSAGTAGGAYLTSQGKLATTALQNLTLGDSSTTGDVWITPNRNVGIGTTSSASKLTVVSSGNIYASTIHSTHYGLKISSDDNSGTRKLLSLTNLAGGTPGGGTEVFGVLANGNVGIGDDTPAAKLTVGSGDLFQVNASGQIAQIDGAAHTLTNSSGDLVLTSAGTQINFANGNVFNIGGITAAAYNALSDSTTTSQGLNSDDDLYIEGDLEVDGTAYFDGALDSNGNVTIADTNIVLDGASTTFTQSNGDITFTPAGDDVSVSSARLNQNNTYTTDAGSTTKEVNSSVTYSTTAQTGYTTNFGGSATINIQTNGHENFRAGQNSIGTSDTIAYLAGFRTGAGGLSNYWTVCQNTTCNLTNSYGVAVSQLNGVTTGNTFNITASYGVFVNTENAFNYGGTMNITNRYGAYLGGVNTAGTSVGTNYGLYIADQAVSSATNGYGIFGVDGDWILDEDGDGAAGGTSGGGDIILGAGRDLELYHDSTNSYIMNNTGDLYIGDAGTDDVILSANGGNVGVGDSSPTALLSVGNGDLFQVNSSGIALGPNGSASNPTFSFTGDPNNGMFLATTDQVGFSSAGVETLRLAANANAQFNFSNSSTNSVNTVLTIAGNSTGTPTTGFGNALEFYGESSTTNSQLMSRIKSYWSTATHASRQSKLTLSTYNVASENDVLTLDGNGNVGIGTTSPTTTLDVNGDIYTRSGITTFGTAVSDGTIEATRFCTGDGETNCVTDFSTIQPGGWTDDGTTVRLTTATDYIAIGANTTHGKVGIDGARVGQALLVLDEEGDQDIWTASASGTNVARLSRTGDVIAKRFMDWSNTAYYLDAADSTTSLLTAGNIGIGTTTASQLLHVNAGTTDTVATFRSSDDTARIDVQDNDTTGYVVAKDTYLSLGGNNSLHNGNININTSSGNVGLGTTAPAHRLETIADIEGLGSITYAAVNGQISKSGASGQGSATAIGVRGSALNAGAGGIGNVIASDLTFGTSNGGITSGAYGIRINNLTNSNTIANTYGVYVGDLSTGTQTNTPYSIYASDANTYNYFNGNVGVGTTSPGQKLDVAGEIELANYLYFGNAATEYLRWDGSSSFILTDDLIPSGSGYGLGSLSAYWGTAYLSGLDISDGGGNAGVIQPLASDMLSFGEFATYDFKDTGLQSFTTLSAPPAAGTSGTVLNVKPVLTAMNGSDTVSLLGINATNANHTTGSNFLYGINVAGITADAEATEVGLFVDTGWDISAIFSGNVGIGDSTPDATLELLSTTEQLRLTHTDGVDETNFTVDTDGNLTINNSGTKTMFSDDVQITGNDILDSSATTRISLGATTTLTNTTTTLSGTTTLTASSLATITSSSALSLGGATSLTFTSDNATIYGSDAINGDLTLHGTSNGTRTSSYVLLQPTAGNVGIGTTAPAATLDIQGPMVTDGSLSFQSILANDTTAYNSNPVAGQMFYNIYTSGGSFAGMGGITVGKENTTDGNYSSYLALHTRTNGSSVAERLRINSAGNVGIGSTSPAYKFDVATDIADYAAKIFNDGNSTSRTGLIIQVGADSGSGTNTAVRFNDGDGTQAGQITFTGTTMTYGSASDVRLKENISVSNRGLADLMQIQVADFNFKIDESKHRWTGFLAQQLYEHFPDAVAVPNNPDDQWNVDYGKVTPLIVKSIQEQQQIIEQQQVQLADITQDLGAVSLDSTGQVTLSNQNGKYVATAVSSGSVLTNISAFAQTITANATTGLTTTKELIVRQSAQIANLSTDSITIAGQSLRDFVAGVVRDTVQQEGLVSPLAQVTLQEDDSFTVTNPSGATIASIDATGKTKLGDLIVTGDASVSGTITSARLTALGELTAGSASISGELIATDITAQTVTAATISAESVRLAMLEGRMAELETIKAQTAELVTATVSGTLYANTIDGFDAKVAAAFEQPSLLEVLLQKTGIQEQPAATQSGTADNLAQLHETISEVGIAASSSADLNLSLEDLELTTEDATLTASAAFINDYLKVNGSAYINNSLAVRKELFVGEGMHIADGTIEYTAAPGESQILAIQPSGTGTLSLLAGLMELNDSGQVTITGNLAVAGDVKVEGSLLSNLLQSAEYGNPFQVQVAGIATESGQVKESRFEIINELGAPVATISAQGRAAFAGGIGIGSESLGAPASEADSVTANKTSGKAAIAANTKEVIIKSELLTGESLIYVTPVGSTENKVLYVKSQTAENKDTSDKEGQFVVGFDEAVGQEVQFNWWIVN